MLLDHNGNKIEISNIKTAGKSQNTWRLSKVLLNTTQVKKQKTQGKLKIF